MKKIKIVSPKEFILKLNKVFTKEVKWCLITSLIAGLLIHFQLYSQELTNPDGIWNSIYKISGAWEASLGRWGITIFDHIRNGLVSPIYSTFVSIFIMSLVAVVIIKLFEIKGNLGITLCSITVMAMPTLSTTLTYWYCSDSYCFSILLAVLAVYFTYRKNFKRKNIAIGAMCFAISLALYQSSVGITVALCVIMPIIQILKNNENTKDVLKKIFYSVIMGIVGVIIYYILTLIVLKIYGTELSSYGGANSVGISSLLNIFSSVKQTFARFIDYYFGEKVLYNKYWKRQYLNLALMIMIGLISLTLIIKKQVYKNKANLAILLILFLILPISLGFIEIIAPERTINLLMAAPYILIIILAIALLEIVDYEEGNVINLYKWIVVLIVSSILFTYILSTNASYMSIKMTNNQAYSYSIRVMDRIENNENYRKNMPMMFAGIISKENYSRNSKIYKMANGCISNLNTFWPSYGGSKITWKKYLSNNLGVDVEWCTDEEYLEILKTEEFKKMGVFPDSDSVKVINDVMVVKFTNNPPEP